MSAFGTKQTCRSRSPISAFGAKADIAPEGLVPAPGTKTHRHRRCTGCHLLISALRLLFGHVCVVANRVSVRLSRGPYRGSTVLSSEPNPNFQDCPAAIRGPRRPPVLLFECPLYPQKRTSELTRRYEPAPSHARQLRSWHHTGPNQHT